VDSTRDLTAGEAGRVVRLLAGCWSLADAESLADPGLVARRAEDYPRKFVTVLLRAMINQAVREAERR
jgi:hypothetical protein